MSCGCNLFGRPRSKGSLFGIYMPDKDIIKTNDQSKALKNILDRPSIIDYDLETAVAAWERSINDYREYELTIMQEGEESLAVLAVLDELRESPEKYLGHEKAKISKLAMMRVEIYKCQSNLGLERAPSELLTKDGIPTTLSISSNGESPMHMSSTGRLESSFGGSDSFAAQGEMGSSAFSASALGLNGGAIAPPPDPLLSLSVGALTALSRDEGYSRNRKASMVNVNVSRRGDSNEDDRGVSMTPAPSSISRASTAMKSPHPSLRESLMTPRRPSLVGAAAGVPRDTEGKPSHNTGMATLEKSLHKGQNDTEQVDDVSITRVLSVTWAGRLNEVNATQGTFSIAPSSLKKADTTDSKSAQALPPSERPTTLASDAAGVSVSQPSSLASQKIRPRWPHFLQEVWYDVVKWNNYGMQQRRIIKLTEYHVVNIKEGRKITKLYPYLDIASIWLENSGMLEIEMKSGQTICYLSIMAPTIVQQITTRVKARIALEKTVFSSAPFSPGQPGGAVMGPGYSHETAHRLIEAINMDHEKGASDLIHDFAMNLVDKTLAGKRKSVRTGEVTGIAKGSDTADNVRKGRQESLKMNTQRLVSVHEDSAEYSLQMALQRVVFDDSTDEGNTRQAFLNGYSEEKKSLTDIRHFIDGLHEYILTTRGVELAMVYSRAGGFVASTETRAGEKVADTSKNNSNTRSRRSSLRGGAGNLQSLDMVDEESLTMISFMSFSVVEEAVFLPLKDSILEQLPSYANGFDDALRRKTRLFRKRSQQDWNVAQEFVSPLEWDTAVFELSGLDRASTPSMQLHSLARSFKAIYAEFKHSILPNLESSEGGMQAFLGADDLVPIFTYVFCKAELKTPHVYKELMWNLCHPDQLHGECGYYLTVFESVIEYVEIEPTEAMDDRTISVSTTISGVSESSSVESSEMEDGGGGPPLETRRRKTSIYEQTMAVVGIGSTSNKFVSNKECFSDVAEEGL